MEETGWDCLGFLIVSRLRLTLMCHHWPFDTQKQGVRGVNRDEALTVTDW
jgi:hypothetical protein